MDPFLHLANRLYEVVISNRACIDNWGYYLFSDEFKDQLVLRNKIGTIWLCSLFDTLEAQHQHLPRLEIEAKKNSWPSLEHNARELTKFCMVTGELLELYSKEEQIFLQDFRNQLVHSHLSGRHGGSYRIKYIEKGNLKLENIPIDQYKEILLQFYEPVPVNDFQISEMLNRAIGCKSQLRYWTAAKALQDNSDEIYRILRNGEIFSIEI
jgi:hypothetical protein